MAAEPRAGRPVRPPACVGAGGGLGLVKQRGPVGRAAFSRAAVGTSEAAVPVDSELGVPRPPALMLRLARRARGSQS